MPRMPDEDDLSRSMPGSRSVVQGPRDFVGPAVQRAGETIEREALANRAQETSIKRRQTAERDSLDLARARADWQTRRAKEESLYQYDRDQDYATWGKRFGANIYKHRDSSAGLIQSPKVRQKFEAESEADIAASTLGVDERARGIDRGRRKAEGLASVDNMLKVAVTKPRAEADKIIDEARANIDNMAFAGVLLPEEAVEARHKFAESYASLKARQDVIENPTIASRWLEGGGEGGEALIEDIEGFRSEPYLDKGTYRIGFGSDTITLPDGRHVKVKPGMRVSRQDAKRDLKRRRAEFQDVIVKQIGTDAWARLPEHARDGITSFAYNYGSLTDSVAAAAKTGDVSLLAEAVRARAVDNDGENAVRRHKEAALIEGAAPDNARPDYYDYLPPGERIQLQANADAEVARQDKERSDTNDLERYSMTQAVDDDVAQIKETGVPAQLDPVKVAGTLGNTAAAKWLERRQTAAETYAETSKLDNMTDNEISEHLDLIEPKAGSEHFERRQTVYDAVEKKAKKLLDLRLKDPALSVEDSPIVKRAKETFNPENPVSHQALVRARLAAQHAVGISEALQQPVTRDEARRIIAPMQTTINLMEGNIMAAIYETGDNRAGRRAAIKAVRAEAEAQIRDTINHIKATYGDHTPKVLAFAIEQSIRDRQTANIASSVLVKMANGDKPTIVDMQSLEAANETAIAEKAMDGKLPAPQVSAPPKAGQQPAQATGRPNPMSSGQEFPAPPPEKVEYLIRYPETAAEFDKIFGPGAAQRWLPKKPVAPAPRAPAAPGVGNERFFREQGVKW